MNNYFIQDHLDIVILFGAALQFIFLYLIIAFATKADRRAKYEWAQLELLAKIARAQGVKEEEIQGIYKAIK